jgi:hypothetical protein
MPDDVRRDAALAAILFGFGAVYLYAGSSLSLGKPGRLGPGFVPWLVGCGILLIAALITLRGLVSWRKGAVREALSRPPAAWRSLICITGAVLAFGLLIRPAGLLIAASTAVFACTYAQKHSGLTERLLVALVLAGLAVLLFPVALGLPLAIFPADE